MRIPIRAIGGCVLLLLLPMVLSYAMSIVGATRTATAVMSLAVITASSPL